MRSVACIGFILAAAASAMATPLHGAVLDDALRVYAVNVVKTPPFEQQFTGYGIYLGRGIVITAAHVVGHWPFLTDPRVLIAGQELPAKVIKKGSFQRIDLALLGVDATRLPVNLRLRRNPICKQAPRVGMQVIDVTPERTSRFQVISPLLIAPRLRRRFDTLISAQQSSGSGVFAAGRKCLLGIISARVPKYRFQMTNGHIVGMPNGYAGYFVSAAEILKFLPPNMHF
jgi:hypothetical protein